MASIVECWILALVAHHHFIYYYVHSIIPLQFKTYSLFTTIVSNLIICRVLLLHSCLLFEHVDTWLLVESVNGHHPCNKKIKSYLSKTFPALVSCSRVSTPFININMIFFTTSVMSFCIRCSVGLTTSNSFNRVASPLTRMMEIDSRPLSCFVFSHLRRKKG